MQQMSGYRQRRSARKKPRRGSRGTSLLKAHGPGAGALRALAWAGTSWPATAAALLFLASACAYAAMLGGHLSKLETIAARIGDGAANSVGLSAHNVSVSGLRRSTREDILRIVGVQEGGSLVGFDARRARRRLEAEGWIASASILRQFPNTLHIEIVEREPFALWQNDGEFFVIDRSGVTLSRFAVRDHLDLPIVVGAGANDEAHRFINQLEAWPDVTSKVRAAVRVAERRWNLYLGNGIKVLLPEDEVERALAELERLHREHGVLDRAVEIVDLRSPGRTVLRLDDEAIAVRKAGLAKLSSRR